MLKNIRLCLVGFGNVGKALAKLLLKKEAELADRYNLAFKVIGIITGSHGEALDPEGLDLARALHLMEAGMSLNNLGTKNAPKDTNAFITHCPADFMVETTPVNPLTGQPALGYIETAMWNKMHVVTANKGPVVHGYYDLKALAHEQGVRFLFESTVMDGAPIFALFREPLVGAQLISFKGILNSCTNLLLGMMEEGNTLEQAIAYGRSIGITETDPSNDIDGWDAAIKVALLVTVLMDVPLTPQQVDRTGIREVTPAMIAKARVEGERYKLICTAEKQADGVIAKVAPQRVGPDSPFFIVNGTSSYCQFKLDVLPGLGLLESDPLPDTTAYGLFADMLNILKVA